VILVVHQYRSRQPLMPVKQLATTFPATGILIAMCVPTGARQAPNPVARSGRQVRDRGRDLAFTSRQPRIGQP
jgi:hypothetical protein